MAFDKERTIVYIVSRAQYVINKGEYNPATGEFKNLRILVGNTGPQAMRTARAQIPCNTPCQADIDRDGYLLWPTGPTNAYAW